MFNYKTRENARGAQDKITKELWEHINSMYHFIKDPTLPQNLKPRSHGHIDQTQ
jgi:uncharacterized alpha-E superfamily protein